tara:strand:+ start:16 stop:600 length:585 start_codon:yes stop_codon:yes gene_type:complete
MKLYNYKIPKQLGGIDSDINWYKDVHKEIWFDHEYSRYGVEVKENNIVVDCGANVGLFSLYALHKGAKHVYSYECSEEIIPSLTYNLKDTNSTIIKGYVGDKHIKIENILNFVNLPFIDFIKIDIEWAEYDLLLNTPNEFLKRINNWVIEFHDFNNNAVKMLQIIEMFSKCGFDCSLEQIHKNSNLMLLYIKKR